MTFTAELPDDAWARRNEPEMHDVIVMSHWYLVRLVAGKMRQTMPDYIDEEDLRQYGVLGLMRAIKHFDPAKEIAFSKYATNAIRGVILDELRSLDWAPRSLRKRQRDLAKSEQRLKQEQGRTPTEGELADDLGWTEADVQTTRRQVEASLPKSLDELRGAREQDLYSTVPTSDDTEEQVIGDPHEDRSNALTQSVSEFIDGLAEKERSVVVMAYYLGLTPDEIARVLGVEESLVKSLKDEIEQRILSRLEALLQNP
jgi:RNA polymerase sigma factor for flagellar operon FliA